MLIFFKYLKYNLHFNFLSFYTIYLYLYYKYTNNITKKQILKYKNLVIKSGCLTIKIAQNINKLVDSINKNDPNYIFFNTVFNSFYENCEIHSFDYTKKIFKDELNINVDDDFIIFKEDANIKSGSIAQIYKAIPKKKNRFIENFDNYAIKIVHPEIDIQIDYLLQYIKIYDYFFRNYYFLGTIFNLLDIKFIYENLSKQNNMINEHENINYFYDYYIDNEFICIPKPIISTKNILIMEFIDAIDITSLNNNIIDNQNKMIKLLWVLIFFYKDNIIFLKNMHGDLHDFNWKVNKNDYTKLVIFDFGFIVKKSLLIDSTFDMQKIMADLIYSMDIKNLKLLSECVGEFIINLSPEEKNILKEEFIEYAINNNFFKTNITSLENLMTFSIYKKMRLNPLLINICIMTLGIKKATDTYIHPKISRQQMLLLHYISQVNFFKEKKIFSNMCNITEKYYIKNSDFLNYISSNNNTIINLSLTLPKDSNNNIDSDLSYEI